MKIKKYTTCPEIYLIKIQLKIHIIWNIIEFYKVPSSYEPHGFMAFFIFGDLAILLTYSSSHSLKFMKSSENC
jgi:hypothetical protein